MTPNEIKQKLFDFLKSDAAVVSLEGIGELDREAAQARLRELIPTSIQVKQICENKTAVVIAAPHVSFDGWTQFFSRVAATEFSAGRVVARNFRDDNGYDIPVSIGRHIHVNRPTESAKPGGRERVTERARNAYEQYLHALTEAAGHPLPVDLLIEFHGQHQIAWIEIATVGVDKALAERLLDVYSRQPTNQAALPELHIEPLHQLRFAAKHAKQNGVMRPEIAKQALQIELPRGLRRPESNRQRTWTLLRPVLASLINQPDSKIHSHRT